MEVPVPVTKDDFDSVCFLFVEHSDHEYEHDYHGVSGILPPLSIVELHVEHPKLSCRTPQAKIVRIVEQIGRIVEHFRDPTSRIVDFGES